MWGVFGAIVYQWRHSSIKKDAIQDAEVFASLKIQIF